jgi:hypothetical protein
MAWMLPELPAMLTVEFVKSINTSIYIHITYRTKGEKKRLKKTTFH